MKKLIGGLIAASLLLNSGCASIFGDNTRTITVKSTPAGAGVYIDGQRAATTPAVVTIPTYIFNGVPIVIKKPGYEQSTIVVNSKFQPVGFWNLLIWPGFLLDLATGNTVKINPAQLNLEVELSK